MYLIYLGIYVLYLILILVGRYCVPQLIRMSSFRYWTLCIVTVVLPIYSLIVISIGTFHNVIFEATTFQEILVSMVGLNDSWQINENRTLTYINNADHDYYVSLVASAIDNITFFLCLGLLTLLIGMRNPKNDTIHNRVEYLLSAEKIDPAARANAVRSIEKLACYNESTEVHLIIEDAEPQNNILKISMRYRSNIVNMFKNERYLDSDFQGKTTVDHDITGKTPLGQIRTVRVGNVDQLDEIKSILEVGTHSTKPIKIEIAPNSSTDFEIEQWIWERFGEEYYVGVSRYTKSLKVYVTNSSNVENIDVSVTSPNSKTTPSSFKLTRTKTPIYEGSLASTERVTCKFQV